MGLKAEAEEEEDKGVDDEGSRGRWLHLVMLYEYA